MLPDLEEKNMDLEKPTVSALAPMGQSYSIIPVSTQVSASQL